MISHVCGGEESDEGKCIPTRIRTRRLCAHMRLGVLSACARPGGFGRYNMCTPVMTFAAAEVLIYRENFTAHVCPHVTLFLYMCTRERKLLLLLQVYNNYNNVPNETQDKTYILCIVICMYAMEDTKSDYTRADADPTLRALRLYRYALYERKKRGKKNYINKK